MIRVISNSNVEVLIQFAAVFDKVQFISVTDGVPKCKDFKTPCALKTIRDRKVLLTVSIVLRKSNTVS